MSTIMLACHRTNRDLGLCLQPLKLFDLLWTLLRDISSVDTSCVGVENGGRILDW